MVIKIAIVEDEKESTDALKSHIEKFGSGSGDKFIVKCFSDGDELLDDYRPAYNIIFLDIRMKRLDGMSAARKIREKDKEVILIFVTNMAQYAIEGYSVGALDFLLKPVHYFAFAEQLKKSVERLKARKSAHLLLLAGDGLVKTDVSQIYYIESFRHDLSVHTKEGVFKIADTLGRLEKQLADHYFFRCGKSYLVNLALVDSINGNKVVLGEKTVFVSRSRKKQFLEAVTRCLSK